MFRGGRGHPESINQVNAHRASGLSEPEIRANLRGRGLSTARISQLLTRTRPGNAMGHGKGKADTKGKAKGDADAKGKGATKGKAKREAERSHTKGYVTEFLRKLILQSECAQNTRAPVVVYKYVGLIHSTHATGHGRAAQASS